MAAASHSRPGGAPPGGAALGRRGPYVAAIALVLILLGVLVAILR
jgi:hypothetical protein